MDPTPLFTRIGRATELANKLKALEQTLDPFFFETTSNSVAPPPDHFFTRLAPTTTTVTVPPPTNKTTEISYPENIGQIIGSRIRHFRGVKKFTQQQLATATNIRRPNIARLEKGQTLPNLATLIRISVALQISLSELINFESKDM